MHGLFVTGTDTGVGKTFITASIAGWLVERGACVGAYKPVASGVDGSGPSDGEILFEALNQQFPLEWICPQMFTAPLSPPVAASLEGRQVDSALLRSGVDRWRKHCDILLIEGAGGLLSPISDQDSVADLAIDLGFPLLIVAANHLGAVNKTLLTVEAALHRKLSIAAIWLNTFANEADSNPAYLSNIDWIKRSIGDIPIIMPPLGLDANQYLRSKQQVILFQTEPGGCRLAFQNNERISTA